MEEEGEGDGDRMSRRDLVVDNILEFDNTTAESTELLSMEDTELNLISMQEGSLLGGLVVPDDILLATSRRAHKRPRMGYEQPPKPSTSKPVSALSNPIPSSSTHASNVDLSGNDFSMTCTTAEGLAGISGVLEFGTAIMHSADTNSSSDKKGDIREEIPDTTAEHPTDSPMQKLLGTMPLQDALPFDFSEYPWAQESDEHDDENPRDSNVNLLIDTSDALLIQEPSDEDFSEQEPKEGPKLDPNVDPPLYAGTSITVQESLAAILSFVQCEHLSGAGLGRLLSLISLHLPQPNQFSESTHNLLRLLETLEDPVFIHYFCSNCYKVRSSQSDLCDVCTDESRTVCYFIQFPLLPQLCRLFKRPDFVEGLSYKHTRNKEHAQNIEDIYDGENYKNAELRYLKSKYDISFMWNADGLQIFKSTSFSLWPFYLCINELSPEKRFASENMIIAGLWGCLTKPHPNLFLLPIYQDLKLLKSGVEIEVHNADKQVIHAEVICGTCDSPARAMFFNQKMHSGFYSCPMCMCRGEKPGDTTVFPYEEDTPLRDKAQYEDLVKLAVKNKILLNKNPQVEERACGIKGPTVLASLVDDMFSSTAIDSMHAVYLGVMRQLIHLWIDKDHKNEAFSLIEKIKLVNHRLHSLSLPHFLQRVPRNIEKVIYWKASELRNFLLYLAAIVLRGVLNDDHFNHFLLLVHGVSLLNSSSISESDLILANLLLNLFVAQFSGLYGSDTMSHNVHLLLHLERCVRFSGALWAVSCFKFEDMNGRLTNFIHGTRHTGLQIYSNLCIITKLPLLVENVASGKVKTFCKELTKKFRLKVTEKISSGIYCIGVLTPLNDSCEWIQKELSAQNIVTSSCSMLMFHRLLKSNVLLVSSMYSRGTRNSSCVKYVVNNEFAHGSIQCFVKMTCKCDIHPQHFAVLNRFKTHHIFYNNNNPVTHILQCEAPNLTDIDFVKIDSLVKVLFYLKSDGVVYVSEPLNKFEME